MEISENLLKTLGMNQLQARVYVAALELGESTMQALARKSGVNRSTIYTFIDDLKDRGFILETRKQKRNIYSAAHPERLVDMQKRRVGELERMLPELLAVDHKPDKHIQVVPQRARAARHSHQNHFARLGIHTGVCKTQPGPLAGNKIHRRARVQDRHQHLWRQSRAHRSAGGDAICRAHRKSQSCRDNAHRLAATLGQAWSGCRLTR